MLRCLTILSFFCSDEGEDEREDTALSAAENEDNDDSGRKSTTPVPDEITAAEEASQSDAASHADEASDNVDDMSAGDED